ncbi:MAG: iron ABC transporter permease [Candidatus Krumholzibacteriota bacterium]|nr:iron ABC transporter permease [Candidatus Krumholzibacteriota bacterium]
MKGNKVILVTALALISLSVVVWAPFVGMEKISPGAVLRGQVDEIKADIFWRIRIPRVTAAFCAGAALALSGMAFQAMFRNPLATPFTLGVSSGAAFGATLYLVTGMGFSLLFISGQSLSALAWAVISILLVYGLTRARKGFSTATMLIAGVAVNFFFSSVILFMQYISDFTNSFRIIRWLMGGFEIAGFRSVFSLLPFVLIGGIIVFAHVNELNLMTAGEDIALSRGVNVKRTRTLLFFATSMMVGGVVSLCGPIAFIGMMAPHICRLIVGSNHRYLSPASFIFGGAFLVFCDTWSRTLIAPAEIPVGVITSLLGGPFFLGLLLSGLSEYSFLKNRG